MITVKKFVVNPLQENSFVLFDESGECVIVDAGFYYGEEQDEITAFIDQKGLKPVRLLNTHCHFDHLFGIEFLRSTYQIPFYCHADDAFWVEKAVDQGSMFGVEVQPVASPDGFIAAGETIRFGNSALLAIHVPGHSPGHLTFYSEADGFLIAGDVLFYGSIGRTDLPGGNYHQLISSIKNRLLVLPDATRVYCGHGPETTIGFEKRNNPFLS